MLVKHFIYFYDASCGWGIKSWSPGGNQNVEN